jgi:hypothetical protein
MEENFNLVHLQTFRLRISLDQFTHQVIQGNSRSWFQMKAQYFYTVEH